MGHDHAHSHGAGARRAGTRHQQRLVISFVVIAVFFVVEAVGGVVANSLALLSDAGHDAHRRDRARHGPRRGCDEVHR